MFFSAQAAQFFPPLSLAARWYRSKKVLSSELPHDGREKMLTQVGGVGGGGLGGGGKGGGEGGGGVGAGDVGGLLGVLPGG
jgi:hypothetical protein